MMKGAVDAFLNRVCGDGIPRPEVVTDPKVEGGWFSESNALFVRPSGDMNELARGVLGYIVHCARTGQLAEGAEQPILDQIIPHLTIRCRGFSREGRDGKPACVVVIGFPSFCGTCYSPTGKVG